MVLLLYFANNSLTGPLTAELIGAGRQSATSYGIDFSGNSLGGTIPTNLLSSYTVAASSRRVQDLYLELNDCGITGTLPLIDSTLDIMDLSLNKNSLTSIPASSWSDYLNTSYTLHLDVSHNMLPGHLSFPSRRGKPSLDFSSSSNRFTSISLEGDLSYLHTLDVGMNTEMTGTILKSLLADGSYSNSLYFFYAGNTLLSGDFPNLSKLTTSLHHLDLSNTRINFCPPTLTSRWNANLYECDLHNTNASACIDKYPILCKFILERPQPSPVSPSNPSTPSSSPDGAPTSSASSWTPLSTVLAMVALLGIMMV